MVDTLEDVLAWVAGADHAGCQKSLLIRSIAEGMGARGRQLADYTRNLAELNSDKDGAVEELLHEKGSISQDHAESDGSGDMRDWRIREFNSALINLCGPVLPSNRHPTAEQAEHQMYWTRGMRMIISSLFPAVKLVSSGKEETNVRDDKQVSEQLMNITDKLKKKAATQMGFVFEMARKYLQEKRTLDAGRTASAKVLLKARGNAVLNGAGEKYSPEQYLAGLGGIPLSCLHKKGEGVDSGTLASELVTLCFIGCGLQEFVSRRENREKISERWRSVDSLMTVFWEAISGIGQEAEDDEDSSSEDDDWYTDILGQEEAGKFTAAQDAACPGSFPYPFTELFVWRLFNALVGYQSSAKGWVNRSEERSCWEKLETKFGAMLRDEMSDRRLVMDYTVKAREMSTNNK